MSDVNNNGVYSVFDSKAEAYLPPFTLKNDALALRAFVGALTDDNHVFSKHSADYTLFRVGSWDESKGLLIPLKSHSNLGNGLQLRTSIAKDYMASQASDANVTALPAN